MEKSKRKIIAVIIFFFLCGGVAGWYVGWKRGVPFVKTQFNDWAIGIFSGKSPFTFATSLGLQNPVLTYKDVTDIRAGFVADPFMVHEKDTWYLFFEAMDKDADKGDIALATSVDGFHWNYQKVVLDEPFHLSYPYVFKWENEYYMVPETKFAFSVRLYKAVNFPIKWVFVGNLLDNVAYVDSSLFYFNKKWWMFTTSGKNEFLHLFYADYLRGPWTEHSKSPVVRDDPNKARCGGRVLVVDGKIIRYAQDDLPKYGNKIRAFEIVELTTTDFKERELEQFSVAKSDRIAWNKDGMHNIDAHQLSENQWIAVMDGYGKEYVYGLRY